MSNDITADSNAELRPLGDFLDIIKERGGGPLPIYSVTLRDGMQRRDGLGRIIRSELNSEDNLFAAKNDICYNMMRMWQGASGLAPEDCLVSPAYVVCRPRKGLHPGFAAHLLKSELAIKAFIDRSQGVTSDRWRLYPEEFLKIRLPVPPLPEQKKIAEILSGIDSTIENLHLKALKIISSKRNVFGDFLAGKGRSTREVKDGEWTTGVIDQADHIPSGWEIVNINDVAQLESGHTPSRRHSEYWGGSIPWISLADSKRLDGDHEITETSENTNSEGISNSSARLLPKGTVCLSRTASIGKCIIMGREMATSQDFANFICGPRLNNYFLLFLFRYMQETWKSLAGGSTHQTIYMPIFKSLQIPLPAVQEQKRITDIMISFDRAHSALHAKISKLTAIRTSLASDLLSGRKRVTV